MPNARTPLIPLLACLALAACAEDPFVDATPAALAALPPGGVFAVCHAPGASVEEVNAAARDVCDKKKLGIERRGVERYQCRLLAIHRTHYTCK